MRTRARVWAGLVVGCLLSGCAAGPVEEYDVVVYGGSPAGLIAATAAAERGHRVVVVEPTAHLGGMITGGLSRTDIGNPNVIGGRALDFFQRAARHYGPVDETASGGERAMFFSEPHVAEQTFEQMVREAGVTVIRSDRVDTVTMTGPRIERIKTTAGRRLAGRVFIDASYEGDLMARAGVDYIVGREAREQYGEALAGFRPAPLRPRTVEEMAHDDPDVGPVPEGVKPLHYVHGTPVKIDAYDEDGKLLPGVSAVPWPAEGSADGRTQAYNFRVIVTRDPANRVPFPKPANYDPRRYELLRRLIAAYPGIRFSKLVHLGPIGRRGKFDLNAIGLVIGTDHVGGNADYPDGAYATRDRIWADHVDWVQGFLYFLANDPRLPADLREQANTWGLAKDEFVDNDNWPYHLYVREARRMIGAYVMTQEDLTRRLFKDDSIGMGSFIMDSHAVQRLVHADGYVIDEGNFDIPVRPYEIPYRAITPKRDRCDNLLVPVCVSASHVAYGSIRMEPQYMIMGHAAGVAASMAAESDAAVQAIDVAALQQTLRDEGQVVSTIPNTQRTADLPGIVVDDYEAELAGDWRTSSWGDPLDGASIHDGDARDGQMSATLYAQIPEPGRYEVRLAYVAAPNRSSVVPVVVHHADGEARSTLNQRDAPPIDGLFVKLGVFRYEAGRRAVVTVNNAGANGYVSVDAVQLIPVD